MTGIFPHRLFLTAFMAVIIPFSVQAQEASGTMDDDAQVERPALIEMEKYTGELLQGLTPDQAQYIYEIRINFGVIRSISEAKKQVASAVNACGEHNEDLKEPIETRFQAWDEAVSNTEEQAEAALEEAIQRQAFRPVARVNMLLDKIDAAFEERDSQVEKVPVTTYEACDKLLKSMDETQGSMTSLLEQTANTLNGLAIES